MAFTELYCNSASGSNLNAGAPLGGSYPFTSTNGAFTQAGGAGGTDRFTASSGTPFATIADGDFVSVTADAAAAPTTFVGRVTAHTNTTLDISLTAIAGTRPTTAASGITARVGGAWLGSVGASGFPFGFLTAVLTNVAGDMPRANFKAGTNYAITAAMTHALIGPVRFQGYTTTPGDGGKAIFDGGISGAAYTLLTLTSATNGCSLVDLIFQNNGASGSATGVSVNMAQGYLSRVVISAMRGSGLNNGGLGTVIEECEVYGCNQSNGGNAAGITTTSSTDLVRCTIHDNVGNNTRGVFIGSGAGVVSARSCVFDSNGNAGVDIQGNSVGLNARHCDFYNNGGGGILASNVSSNPFLLAAENCNFVKNGAVGIRRTGTAPIHGILTNCGFGSGTQVNTGGATSNLGSVVESGSITYAADQTPWINPDAGDFRLNLATAKGTGRGLFTQTQAGYAGTVSYPDMGSAQHLDTSTLTFNTQNLVRFTLKDKVTGQGKTGLSPSTPGLVISTICDNEATAIAYTQAGSTIETIATLGLYAAPTASKCRFREVDAVSNRGLYEFQFADSRYAISNAKKLVVSVNDAESTLLDADYEIPLTSVAGVSGAEIRAALGLSSANLDTQLSGIQADTDDVQTRLPVALVGGRMDSSVGAMAANTLTATTLAADAVAEIVAGVWDENIIAHQLVNSAGAALILATSMPPDPWDTTLPGAYATGTAGALLGRTSAITFTVAGTVDCNVTFVNSIEVKGTGVLGDEWGPV